jgi:hypothetical protein
MYNAANGGQGDAGTQPGGGNPEEPVTDVNFEEVK